MKKTLKMLILLICIISLSTKIYAVSINPQNDATNNSSIVTTDTYVLTTETPETEAPETETPTDTIEWTDFSNADFQILKTVDNNGYASTNLTIVSDMNYKTNHSYDLYINNSNTKPTEIFYTLTKEDGTFNVNVDQFVEKAGDIYIWIVENAGTESKTVIEATKLDRPNNLPLGSRITGSFFKNANSIINFYEVKDINTSRNVQIKIGAVSDVELLKEIQNRYSTPTDNLLAYAKASTNVYLQTTLEVGQSLVPTLSNITLAEGSYYYVYFLADDVSGTYYPVEDVGLYQYQYFSSNGGQLVSSTDQNFVWDFDNNSDNNNSTTEPDKNEDSTTADVVLPDTGEKTLSIVIFIILLSSALFYLFFKRYKDIE